MKLGLLADIHESNELLQVALDRFRAEDVDQVVVLGDLFELGLNEFLQFRFSPI